MISADPRELTLDYLRTLLSRGESNVPISEEARQVLRKWVIAARRLARGESPYIDNTQGNLSITGEQPVANAERPQIIDAEALRREVREVIESIKNAKAEDNFHLPEHITFELEGNTREEKLLSLQELITNWPLLRERTAFRDKPVFGAGNPHADIMMVADAPGSFEENRRIPMAGPAGEKLDAMLKAMGLTRERIYLTYMVKYRPALPKQLTNNRPPTELEIAVFRPILKEEVQLVNPKVIVALGPIAARGILNSGPTPLSALRGEFHTAFDTPVRVTYNPSYLLRTDDIAEKRKLWEDLLSVMDKVGLPVSEKQRSYFLPKK